MFEEYEINYMMPLFKRFGLVYYGCCDPLDGKMAEVLKIPNLRKISVSPWASKERCAEAMGGKYVFSNKPNPAHVAMGAFDADLVRRDLTETREICRRHGTPLEFIFKDISTVCHDPIRLKQWADVAMQVACEM